MAWQIFAVERQPVDDSWEPPTSQSAPGPSGAIDGAPSAPAPEVVGSSGPAATVAPGQDERSGAVIQRPSAWLRLVPDLTEASAARPADGSDGAPPRDAGMSTVEYAVGTIAAAAFAAVLYKIVTGDSVITGLTSLINSALHTSL